MGMLWNNVFSGLLTAIGNAILDFFMALLGLGS
jgi:hypothetical protein